MPFQKLGCLGAGLLLLLGLWGCSDKTKTRDETAEYKPMPKLADFAKPKAGSLPPVPDSSLKGSIGLAVKNFPFKLEVNTDWEVCLVAGGTLGGLEIDAAVPVFKFSAKDLTFALIPMDPDFNLGIPFNKNLKRTLTNDQFGHEFGAKFQATRWLIVEVKVGVPTGKTPLVQDSLDFATSTFRDGKLTFAPAFQDSNASHLRLDSQRGIAP